MLRFHYSLATSAFLIVSRKKWKQIKLSEHVTITSASLPLYSFLFSVLVLPFIVSVSCVLHSS